ncbi:hypothetical protein K439DRAFT_1404726 [Ramaria rubella]|nr:hypothetical protein K439DRAFT_1404726 [Ramaria rubella]
MSAARPAMTVLGSVFLGDAHHHRVFSTTPPTSPPPASGSPSFSFRAQQIRAKSDSDSDLDPEPTMETVTVAEPKPEIDLSPPTEISPAVSLELRLRWLEALLLGVRRDAAKETSKGGRTAREEAQKQESLYRRAEDVQQKLETIVESNDGFKRFMEQYDQHAQFLTPSFALSGLPNSQSAAPSYSSMSSTELDALLSEMEIDVRAADRDLREIDVLEKRGVTGAGKLVVHEALQPRLRALLIAHEEDLAKATSLENRIGALLERHATKVDALSELFVAWNDVITDAEDRVAKAERSKAEQRRLGYE